MARTHLFVSFQATLGLSFATLLACGFSPTGPELTTSAGDEKSEEKDSEDEDKSKTDVPHQEDGVPEDGAVPETGEGESGSTGGEVEPLPFNDEIDFYFVVHADPASMMSIKNYNEDCSNFAEGDGHWDRLVAFMNMVNERNMAVAETEQHHISIMFTSPYAWFMAHSPCASQAQAVLADWIAQGHEMAFHSHSQTHKFRDGYSNEVAWIRGDLDEGSSDRNCVNPPMSAEFPNEAWLEKCSVDTGLRDLELALTMATGSEVDLRFARIGPLGNSTDPEDPNAHAASCTIDMEELPAGKECIAKEWTGHVADTIEHTTLAYKVQHCFRDLPSASWGDSECVQWTAEGPEIYGIPHAPLRVESGELRIGIETLASDINGAKAGTKVGVVIHPATYTESMNYSDRQFCDDRYTVLNPKAYIEALFDVLDGIPILLGEGVIAEPEMSMGECECFPGKTTGVLPIDSLGFRLASRTLSEVRDRDEMGEGAACR